jgi:hypothetical protein
MPSVCSFSGADTTATSDSRSSLSGHRRPATTKRAEQVPRTPADVPEPDEANMRVGQRPCLRYRRVVHRRRPHVAAQLTVLGQEVAAQHHRGRDHILSDGSLMVKRVGHHNVRRQCVEIHLVAAGPGDVNQPQLLRRLGHFCGEAAADIDVGVPQFVQWHATHMPAHLGAGWHRAF